jgi:hypothetical protein
LDVDPKAIALPSHVSKIAAIQAKVVQAGFANANHFGFGGQFQQTSQRGFCHAFVVGVHARGAEEAV